MTDQKHQERQEVLDHLAYLKVVTSQKMKYGRQTAPYFIVWGTIWFIGYGTEGLGFYDMINWVWGILGPIGMAITIWLIIRQSQTAPLPAFFGQQIGKVWGVFMAVVTLFLILIALDLLAFDYHLIGLYSVFLVSIMYMLLGVVLGREIFIMGIWIGVLGAITAIWFADLSGIIFAMIGGGSMVTSGVLLLRRRDRDD